MELKQPLTQYLQPNTTLTKSLDTKQKKPQILLPCKPRKQHNSHTLTRNKTQVQLKIFGDKLGIHLAYRKSLLFEMDFYLQTNLFHDI